MAKKIDIHDYAKKLESEIKSIKNSKISKNNKELILKFADFCFMEGLTKARVGKLLNTIKLIALKLNLDFEKACKEDIMKLIQKIETNDNYSVWTKQCYKVVLKKFYKWFKGNNKNYPDEVEWIKTNIKKSQLRLPSEEGLLTEKDIKSLISAARHPRDKALISVLYESGCRIGEIMSLKINNVVFDKIGSNIVVTGKTGSRRVRLIASTPYLASWLDHHPNREDNEAPLWIVIGNHSKEEFVNYGTARMIIKRLFDKAGIKKRANPHLFRHSRATFLANHLTEFQMNQYFGWIQGSNMPSTYVHMSGKEVDNAILALNGEQTISKEEEVLLKPRKCPRCSVVNGYESEYCCKCGGVLDLRTAFEHEEKEKEEVKIRKNSDELMNILMKDPTIQELLVKKIMEMGLRDKLESLKVN